MDQILPAIIAFIVGFASKYPIVASILMVIGTLRLIFKPLMPFLHQIVLAIPGDADDKLLDKVEQSAVWKTILWVLDLFASIKLPAQKQ